MENGLSQIELAKASGVTNRFISDLEKGKKNPSLHTAVKISKALKCKIDELVK